MAPPQAAAEFQASQALLAATAVRAARSAWQRMGGRFDEAWRTVGPLLTILVTAAQLSAARRANQYVSTVMRETEQDAGDPSGELRPDALAGVSSDGRPLEQLLYGAVVRAGMAANTGVPVRQALAIGQSWLEALVTTQVADASRVAVEAVIASRARVGGYVRMVDPPCCQRCAILAGKWFRYYEGFERHPDCQCTHIPASEDVAGDLRTDPTLLLREGQITDLTQAQRQALDLGADLNQIVNASRGMDTTNLFGRQIKFTREGVTIRGFYGSRRRGGYNVTKIGRYGYVANYSRRTAKALRLMPETLLAGAEDRADAIRLLKLYGYIT